jgi:hypothetical protein
LTFNDLKKRISLETTTQQQQYRLAERFHKKPFWIWNIAEHKQEDVKTNGHCCFNHVIGLPQKDDVDRPFYDYQKIVFDFLVTDNGNKHFYAYLSERLKKKLSAQKIIQFDSILSIYHLNSFC